MMATMQNRGRTLFPKTLQIGTHIVLRMEKGEKINPICPGGYWRVFAREKKTNHTPFTMMKSLKKSGGPPVVTSPDAYYKDVSVSRKFRLFERCSAMIVREGLNEKKSYLSGIA